MNRCSAQATAAFVGIVFAVNAGSYSIQARPDFLVLLEIAGILAAGQLAARGRLTQGPFGVLLGILTLAAYLTKPYSLFAWGAALGLLGLSRGLRQAAAPALVSASILAAGVWAYAHHNPLYLFETFDAHLAHASPDFAWLVHQTSDFAVLACGPILAAIGGAVLRMRSRAEPDGNSGREGRLPEDARSWAWITGLAAIALLAGLGWHTGAYLTYYIHLMLVPLCLCAAAMARPPRGGSDPPWLGLTLLVNLVVLMVLAPSLPRADPGWAELRDDVVHQPGLVGVDFIMEPMARLRGDVVVADTGMTRYALEEPGLVHRPSATALGARVEAAEFQRRQTERLGSHPPDAVYLDYIAVQKPGGRPGEEVLVLRNGLPWYSGAGMTGYVRAKAFRIFPYYCATNERRQYAGTWSTVVIKWVRKPP